MTTKPAVVFALVGAVLLGTADRALAQQPSTKVYWLAVTDVPLGKLAEYHAFVQTDLKPLQEKHGYKFVAVWQTIVGDIQQVVIIAEFESMATYHQARVSLLASPEWRAHSAKFDALTRGIRTSFLSATPYSPLK